MRPKLLYLCAALLFITLPAYLFAFDYFVQAKPEWLLDINLVMSLRLGAFAQFVICFYFLYAAIALQDRADELDGMTRPSLFWAGSLYSISILLIAFIPSYFILHDYLLHRYPEYQVSLSGSLVFASVVQGIIAFYTTMGAAGFLDQAAGRNSTER
jgi:hypothetical protein